MSKLSSRISHNGLYLLALFILALAEPADADSIIRIIGDGTTKASGNSGALAAPEFPSSSASGRNTIRIIGDKTTASPVRSAKPTEQEPPSSSVRGSTTIRIIGDKPSAAQKPVSQQTARPEPNRPPSPIKEIRTTGDTIDSVQKKTTEHPSIIEEVKKENKATTNAAEEESPTKETAEHQLNERLARLKAEEERKAAEKAEQKRLAKEKTEQENEAARQETIELERKQLATRMAEEARKAAEKVEQEKIAVEAARQAAIKQEQEQLAARIAEEERKATEKVEQEKIAAEAARQAAIKMEQVQLAARKAEELRKAAERAEQERTAAMKAEEERLATARKALAEKLRQGKAPEPPQAGSNSPSVDSSTSVSGTDIRVKTVTESDSTGAPAPAAIWDLYLAAKANDPALGRTEARVTGSKADSDLLFSGLLPHLDSSAGVRQTSQTVANYNTSTDGNYDFTALNYNVTARMTLLHVPTLYSLSAAAAGLSVEQAGVAAARQNLIVKLTDSYFALLKAQTDKQIALGEINRLKQVLDQSQAFLKAGTGDIISVYEAQSRLDSAGADLTKSESNLRLAEQKLSNQVGKPVTEVVNYLPQQPAGPDPDNIDWWVATMEKEQPAIRQAREGVVQSTEQRKAAKAEYLPVLQASGGYDVNRGTAALPTAEVRQWFVGASISLPLYSGGETSAKVRRAAASEEERQHILDETMDQQRENIKQAFFNLRYNISLIKALEQRKASAEIQLAAVKKGRKIGTRNAIDVLNAEQGYSVALRDYRYALYDNIIRVIQLKSAAGILAETDVSRLSDIEAPPPGNGLNLIISQVSR